MTDHRYSVTNSQILANVVFVYCDETRNIRSGTHIVALNLMQLNYQKILY